MLLFLFTFLFVYLLIYAFIYIIVFFIIIIIMICYIYIVLLRNCSDTWVEDPNAALLGVIQNRMEVVRLCHKILFLNVSILLAFIYLL